MALPIKETPIIKGKLIKLFFDKYLDPKPISKTELERLKKNYKRFNILD